jgi:hypothetical protein
MLPNPNGGSQRDVDGCCLGWALFALGLIIYYAASGLVGCLTR